MTVVERAGEVAGNPVLAGLSGFSYRSFGWIFDDTRPSRSGTRGGGRSRRDGAERRGRRAVAPSGLPCGTAKGCEHVNTAPGPSKAREGRSFACLQPVVIGRRAVEPVRGPLVDISHPELHNADLHNATGRFRMTAKRLLKLLLNVKDAYVDTLIPISSG